MGWDDKTYKTRLDEVSWLETSVDHNGRWVEVDLTQQRGAGESNKRVIVTINDYSIAILVRAFREMVKQRRAHAQRLENTLDRRE